MLDFTLQGMADASPCSPPRSGIKHRAPYKAMVNKEGKAWRRLSTASASPALAQWKLLKKSAWDSPSEVFLHRCGAEGGWETLESTVPAKWTGGEE